MVQRIPARSWSIVGAILIAACNKSPDSGLGDGTTNVNDDGDDGNDASPGTADGTGTGGSGGASTGPVPPKYDVGAVPDAPPPLACNGSRGGGSGPQPGEPLYSYIWIANSSQDTVSKIDTVTLEERGRYRTHPTYGNPSRTSVSLNGDVAVANRDGGLVKFFANPADCVDANGNGLIDTSTGPNDILPWEDEECRAWFIPMDEYSSQRPVAWSPGQWSPDECRYVNEKVWTAGAHDGTQGGPGGGGPDFPGVHVVRVDGDSGVVEAAVKIPEIIPGFYGIYGGAVDAGGNFWGAQLCGGDILRVDIETMDYQVWANPVCGYGMTVDSMGQVWSCSSEVGRFEPDTETWQTAQANGSGGCMEDGQGTLWLASSPLVGVDIETLQIVATWPLPEYVHGVSIDFQGYVWGVSMGTNAYRVDPTTGAFDTVGGLVGPYTYSDMTGFALANAGGWTPAG